MQHNSALATQAQHYKAVRDRLFNSNPPKKVVAPKPAPQLLLVRDFDAHVDAWRKWGEMKRLLSMSSTSASFPARIDWEQHAALVESTDNADEIIGRRPMKDICLDVLQDFPGVTLEEVRGRHRNRNIVAARQACMYAIYTERKDISFPRLGHFFGGRDHTTALYSVSKVAATNGDKKAANGADTEPSASMKRINATNCARRRRHEHDGRESCPGDHGRIHERKCTVRGCGGASQAPVLGGSPSRHRGDDGADATNDK